MDIGKGSKKGKWHILTDARNSDGDWDGHHFGAGTMCKNYIHLEEFKRRVKIDEEAFLDFCSKCKKIVLPRGK